MQLVVSRAGETSRDKNMLDGLSVVGQAACKDLNGALYGVGREVFSERPRLPPFAATEDKRLDLPRTAPPHRNQR